MTRPVSSSAGRRVVALLAGCLLVTALAAPRALAAPVSTAFTYQGSLDRAGLPMGTGCTFQFKLFDSLGGSGQIGPTLTPTVTVYDNGQFSCTLDFGAGVFDGNARWLEIAVQCTGDPGFTALTPRQPITVAPYALYALSAPGGGTGFTLPYAGAVTSSAQDAFRVQNNATSTSFSALHGVSASTIGGNGAVFGEATATTGGGLGVYGLATASPGGTGVVGKGGATGAWFESFHATGDGTGVWGVAHTSLNSAGGVKGVNYSSTGNPVGVWGIANSGASGTGVAGVGSVYGVTGSGADGVHGLGSNAGVSGSGTSYGVLADSYSGFGVYATYGLGLNPVSGTNAGVYGNSASTNGGSAGVRGEAGPGSGVEGISASGAGVYGHSASSVGVSGSSPSYFGVLGVSGSQAGVKGISGSGAGVYGQSSSLSGFGVFGTNTTGDAIWGQSSGAGKSGVVGLSYNAAGVGGWFQNNAGGVALHAEGLAQVKTLQILGADLAESFPVKDDAGEPGTVLVIDDGAAGRLRVADEAYSTRVAGVVSGANGLDAAVVLKGKSFDEGGHAAVALSGRVWVKCDATGAPIHTGDLLTTSNTRGHAMRASDRDRAYGAILGKAMSSLETGTGLVLVLVGLQ